MDREPASSGGVAQGRHLKSQQRPISSSFPMRQASTNQKALDGSLSTHNGFSLITNEKLLAIYSMMLKCRMIEERLHAIGKHGSRPLRSSTSVHVAAIAGAAIDLLPGDALAPSLGALTPCFAKGLSLRSIFASALGDNAAPRPSYAALNLVPPSFSARKQFERALEAAAAYKARRSRNVVAVFSGDASSSSDELEGAMQRAGKRKLPILFVHATKLRDDELLMCAKDCGFPGIAAEDDDAVAVYRVATESLAHARRGNGPTLIECRPWPFDDHGSGKRRPAKHPVSKMETYLAGKGLFSRSFKGKLIAGFNRELDAAIEAAKSRAL